MNGVRTPQMLSQGQTIQWYRVEEVLGRGGFGITYLATDNNLDHRVAIKEYLPTGLVERQADKSLVAVSASAQVSFQEGLQRFLSEARTLVKFRHKNIVRVMTVFEAHNTAYLVMEYEQGERFKEAVSSDAVVDEAGLKSLLLDIIDGLEQVHQHGFIHRDIKPVNIIIRDDGSPVLLDFGASRVLERTGEAAPTSYVSAGFTPMEQYQEGTGMEPGPWTDIYSLAATLYYAITGKTPVSAVSRLASFVKSSADPLTPATEAGHGKYSGEFLEAIDWALRFKPEDRPQSLSEWRDAIVSAGEGGIAAARAGKRGHRTLLQKNRTKTKSRPVWQWLAATLAAFGVAVSLWYLFEQRELQQLVNKADVAFESDDAFDAARPLYVQALAKDPGNNYVKKQIDALDQRAEQQVLGLIDEQQFDAAATALEQLAAVQPARASELQAAIEQSRVQNRLKRAQGLIDAGQYNDALSELAVFKQNGSTDERFAALEQQAQTGARQQLEQQRLQEAQRARRQQQQLETERRLAEANERQRKRRSTYRQYLNNARSALDSDNIETARRWFDSANAMQINDAELSALESRLLAAEKFLQTPLSSYELSYAKGQFNALKRAVELKNLSAIEALVGADTSRINLFKTLFARYTQLSVEIINVEATLNPKQVSATLRIEKMAQPNGDVVFPASSYRDSALSIDRQRYSWSPIRW